MSHIKGSIWYRLYHMGICWTKKASRKTEGFQKEAWFIPEAAEGWVSSLFPIQFNVLLEWTCDIFEHTYNCV